MCAGYPDNRTAIEENYKQSGAVFFGEAAKISRDADGRAKIVFKVEKQFKGTHSAEIEVYQPGDIYFSAPRMMIEDVSVFSVGEKYLVYAHEDGDTLSVGSCARVFKASEAASDMEILPSLVLTQ